MALLIAAAERGIYKEDLYDVLPRVDEISFDSGRKRMSTIHMVKTPLPAYFQFLENTPFLFSTKGAADGLLDISDYVWENGEKKPLDEAWKERILQANTQLAGNGIRVLGIAFRMLDKEKTMQIWSRGSPLLAWQV